MLQVRLRAGQSILETLKARLDLGCNFFQNRFSNWRIGTDFDFHGASRKKVLVRTLPNDAATA